MILIVAYLILLFLLSIYSYALLDPNLTLFNSQIWTSFRDAMVYLGYYQRQNSTILYISGVILLFVFHYFFIQKSKLINPLKLAFLIGGVLLFSYPFLSHDFFNYLFDAKIVTFYHQNPYLKRGLDFPHDPWIRFMQWTHRTYPYGPSFLLISLVPSFFSFGKFVASYFFFKIMFIGFYILAVFSLQKMNKRWAVIFATHPLVIVEGLINTHNDLIGISLTIAGLLYIVQKKDWLGRFFILVSVGIKYVTLPYLFFANNKKNHLVITALVAGLMIYWVWSNEIQPWYFLLLFGLLVVNERIINNLFILFAGLLFSYIPYIWLGGWDKPEKVAMKHQIILVFFILNCVYFIFIFARKKFLRR